MQSEVEAFMEKLPLGELGRLAKTNLDSWQKLQREMLDALQGRPPGGKDDAD